VQQIGGAVGDFKCFCALQQKRRVCGLVGLGTAWKRHSRESGNPALPPLAKEEKEGGFPLSRE
jgi:hypothetical protein